MENWENKIIAEKLNSLRDLPEGYAPDLASKWEIIEAGLPQRKNRIMPLFKWAVAAAIISAVFYTATVLFPAKKGKPVSQSSVFQTSTEAIVRSNKQQDTNIKLIQKQALASRQITSTNNSRNKTLLAKTMREKAAAPTMIPILNNAATTTISHIETITGTSLIAAVQPGTIKPVRPKNFQKDFVDDGLTIGTPNITPNQHMGFKIQPNKNAAEESGSSSPALQWKKSF